MSITQKNNGLLLRGKAASRLLFALALTVALLVLFAPDTAMAATITVPDGMYTITQDGTNVVLTDDNDPAFSEVLDATTDIVSGNLMLTVNADVTVNSVCVDGSLFISGNGSTLTANNTTGVNNGCGVYAGGLTIEAGSNLTGNATGTGSCGISAGCIEIRESGVNLTGNATGSGSCGISAGYIEIRKSGVKLTGNATGSGSCGISAGYIEIRGYDGTLADGALSGTGVSYGVKAEYYIRMQPATNYALTGTATGADGVGVYTGDGGIEMLSCVGASLTGTANGAGGIGVYSTFAIQLSNTKNTSLTGTGAAYGVYAKGYINIYTELEGTLLTGTAPYYGVFAEDYISICGSATVKGVATASSRGYNGSDTAAVMAAGEDDDAFGLYGGATVWEDYPNIAVQFNLTTPVDPYANGTNIENIANYTWSPNLGVSGSGLVATEKFFETTITGSLTINDGQNRRGTHKITFKGYTEAKYTVSYDANGGRGSYTVTDLNAGDKHTVLSSSATGIYRTGYILMGWNTKADGTGTYYAMGAQIEITGNLTLYAVWRLNDTGTVTPLPTATIPVSLPQTGGTGTALYAALLFAGALIILMAVKAMRGKRTEK